MKSNLLQYYLNWNVKCYVLIILGISCLIVYVQHTGHRTKRIKRYIE